jgi:hypothetical protein
MKLLIALLLSCCSLSLLHAQTTKYGALAVDRNNGFYYGWAYDHPTLEEAERRALEECNKKGGKGTVVLKWSGAACGAYRTINGNVGTAYGWGVARTQAEADAIALRECQKRSNGQPASNYVWACNSSNTGSFKELYNAMDETPAATQSNSVKETLVFNGRTMEASGDCIDNTASLTADDESMILIINNIAASGSFDVTANFYTNACTSCMAVQLQDINDSKTYVATSGKIVRDNKGITIDVTVKDLMSLIEGGGNSFRVTGKIVCQ